jgi:hypothetical protein
MGWELDVGKDWLAQLVEPSAAYDQNAAFWVQYFKNFPGGYT